MAEVQRYESMVPMRYVVLQGRGHGPVLVRSPGLTTATCLQCEWHGFDRGALPSSDGLIEADGELHLAGLRPKVTDLPSRVELDEVGNEVTWVRYTDVLALLPEGVSE